jgi:hypothetical protein
MDKVLYHGTNHQFSRFDTAYLGSGCDNPTTRFGFFFSESRADALFWAQRASDRRRAPCTPRVVEARLNLRNPLELDYGQFHYYLQTARPSTITRHLEKWKREGYDGMTVVREGVRWYVAFDPSQIEICSL